MKKLKTCKNNCIFCFIKQLPENLRPTLYIKDDDYFESFSHGNFITLTNISKKDIDNIIRFKIEPLHVSVHSFNLHIRNLLFGNTKTSIAIDNLFSLDKGGIRTNIQIVLCPGINDAGDLSETLDILVSSLKKVLSIGIVPVGISKYNTNPLLSSFERESSVKLIDFINAYKYKNRKNPAAKKVYLSDEFYLLAGYDFPDIKEYGRFLQIQNGIGKSVDFQNDFKKQLTSYEKEHCSSGNQSSNRLLKIINNRSLIITSEYGADVLDSCLGHLKIVLGKYCLKYQNKIELKIVKNIFFGGNVKVTGLLTGTDILNSLKNIALDDYKNILIPEIIFNPDGMTLDDMAVSDLKHQVPLIRIVKDNGKDLIKNLAG